MKSILTIFGFLVAIWALWKLFYVVNVLIFYGATAVILLIILVVFGYWLKRKYGDTLIE